MKNTETQSPGSLHRMVRPRPQNLAATVFVFEGTRKPYETRVVYLDQSSCYLDNPKWKHTATLDPAAWIEHLMNNPAERNEQIEGICYRPNVEAGRELLAEVELLRFGCNQVAQVAFERDEAVRENLNLRLKVAAAEGMAEAFESHRCGCQNQELRVTLAAWQEANNRPALANSSP